MSLFDSGGLDDAMPKLGIKMPILGKPQLQPEQSQSMGQSLLDRSKGALGSVLWALDLPGSHIRGVLAGKPGTPTTGRQLLNHWGVTRPGDNGWGSWTAGLAADIATDPFSYATFGAKHALTKGGQALMKGGHLQGWSRKALLEGFHGTESALSAAGHGADYIGHLRDAGRRIAGPAEESAYQAATGQALYPGRSLSGLARASVPFRPDLGVTLGSGKLAQGVASGLDRAGDYLKFGNPISRSLNANFGWQYGRAKDEVSQRAISATVPLRKELESQSRLNEYDVLSGLDKLIRANPGHEHNILRAARISTEGTSPLSFLASARDPGEAALFQDFLNRTKGLGDQIAGFGKQQLETGRRAGLTTADASDRFARYGAGRESTEAYLAQAGPQLERRTIVPTTGKANKHREEIFRNLPGGTDRINDWVNRYAGSKDHGPVASGIFTDILDDYKHLTGAVPAGSDLIAYQDQARRLARRIGGLDPKKYIGQIAEHPYFSHDIAGDVVRRGTQHARTMASSDAIIRGLGSVARKASDFAPGDDYVLLPSALKQLRLGNHDLGSEFVGAGPNLYRALAPKGAGMVQPLVSGGAPYGLNKELAQWAVPKKAFEQLAENYNRWQLPTEMTQPIRLIDSLTNSFKALSYPIWLASHTRNAATAAVNNLRTGTTLGDYAKQFRLMRGSLPSSSAESLRRSQFGHARIFGEGGPNLELAGPISGAAAPSNRQWSGFTPGTNQHGMGRMGPTGNFVGDTANLLANEGLIQHGRDIVNKLRDWKNAPNPYGLSGVAGRERDVFAPVVAGRKLSSNVEDFMRGAQYQGLLRKGYSPEMAAEQIRRFHFDYCVDEQTEILTEFGWRRLDDVSVGENALSIDPDTREIKWTPVRAINVFPSPGNLTRWKTTTFDALTTSGHRWLAKGSGDRGGHYSVRDKKPKQHFVTTGDISHSASRRTKKILIVGGGHPVQPVLNNVFSDEFVELVGWYVTEGSDSDSCHGILVSQSEKHNPMYVDRIRRLAEYFRSLGATATEYTPRDNGHGPIVVFYFGKGIGNEIRAWADGKKLCPRFLTLLSVDQLRLLHQTLIDADGHRKNGTEIWTQKDLGRCDGFQMLCSMLGIRSRASMDGRGVTSVTSYAAGEHLYTEHIRPVEEPYSGRVWCPTTDTGTWMARRNGVTYWTGNSDLAPFERNVMRRLVPFYTFARKNLPLQMETLATRPGAFSTPFKPAMVNRDREEYVPEYLSNGFVTPIGPEQNGSRRFLSSLGLPQEEAFREMMLWNGRPDIQGTAMRYAGNLNPLLKGLLEQMTDRQFYSGRKLSELRPSSTGTGLASLLSDEYAQPVSQFISNTPLTRFATSLDKLMDTKGLSANGRKPGWATALNLLTGARITDVDLDAQRHFEQRAALDRMLSGQPHISKYLGYYVRPEAKKLLTPEESLLLGKQAELQQHAKSHMQQVRRERHQVQ